MTRQQPSLEPLLAAFGRMQAAVEACRASLPAFTALASPDPALLEKGVPLLETDAVRHARPAPGAGGRKHPARRGRGVSSPGRRGGSLRRGTGPGHLLPAMRRPVGRQAHQRPGTPGQGPRPDRPCARLSAPAAHPARARGLCRLSGPGAARDAPGPCGTRGIVRSAVPPPPCPCSNWDRRSPTSI